MVLFWKIWGYHDGKSTIYILLLSKMLLYFLVCSLFICMQKYNEVIQYNNILSEVPLTRLLLGLSWKLSKKAFCYYIGDSFISRWLFSGKLEKKIYLEVTTFKSWPSNLQISKCQKDKLILIWTRIILTGRFKNQPISLIFQDMKQHKGKIQLRKVLWVLAVSKMSIEIS